MHVEQRGFLLRFAVHTPGAIHVFVCQIRVSKVLTEATVSSEYQTSSISWLLKTLVMGACDVEVLVLCSVRPLRARRVIGSRSSDAL